MPYKPKVPCRHPDCPELVESGRLYCEKHLPFHPEATRPIPTEKAMFKA